MSIKQFLVAILFGLLSLLWTLYPDFWDDTPQRETRPHAGFINKNGALIGKYSIIKRKKVPNAIVKIIVNTVSTFGGTIYDVTDDGLLIVTIGNIETNIIENYDHKTNSASRTGIQCAVSPYWTLQFADCYIIAQDNNINQDITLLKCNWDTDHIKYNSSRSSGSSRSKENSGNMNENISINRQILKTIRKKINYLEFDFNFNLTNANSKSEKNKIVISYYQTNYERIHQSFDFIDIPIFSENWNIRSYSIYSIVRQMGIKTIESIVGIDNVFRYLPQTIQNKFMTFKGTNILARGRAKYQNGNKVYHNNLQGQGFSGLPVFNQNTNKVIGMISSFEDYYSLNNSFVESIGLKGYKPFGNGLNYFVVFDCVDSKINKYFKQQVASS